ncbi:hypothetical protein HDU93_004125 [Gonapodya sp. JEL0774]|nr:hypothetical protein HDU93_004125 [Gonapodya sp. JEL0774]
MLYFAYWYTQREFATRVAFFTSATALSSAFSGLLAYGIAFLNGSGGWSGWSFPIRRRGSRPRKKFGWNDDWVPRPRLQFTTKISTRINSDRTQERVWHLLGAASTFLVAIILFAAVPPTPGAGAGFLYFTTFLASAGSAAGAPVLWAWRTGTSKGATGTAVSTALMNTIGAIGGAFSSFIFRADWGPRFVPSFTICAVLQAIGITGILIKHYWSDEIDALQKRIELQVVGVLRHPEALAVLNPQLCHAQTITSRKAGSHSGCSLESQQSNLKSLQADIATALDGLSAQIEAAEAGQPLPPQPSTTGNSGLAASIASSATTLVDEAVSSSKEVSTPTPPSSGHSPTAFIPLASRSHRKSTSSTLSISSSGGQSHSTAQGLPDSGLLAPLLEKRDHLQSESTRVAAALFVAQEQLAVHVRRVQDELERNTAKLQKLYDEGRVLEDRHNAENQFAGATGDSEYGGVRLGQSSGRVLPPPRPMSTTPTPRSPVSPSSPTGTNPLDAARHRLELENWAKELQKTQTERDRLVSELRAEATRREQEMEAALLERESQISTLTQHLASTAKLARRSSLNRRDQIRKLELRHSREVQAKDAELHRLEDEVALLNQQYERAAKERGLQIGRIRAEMQDRESELKEEVEEVGFKAKLAEKKAEAAEEDLKLRTAQFVREVASRDAQLSAVQSELSLSKSREAALESALSDADADLTALRLELSRVRAVNKEREAVVGGMRELARGEEMRQQREVEKVRQEIEVGVAKVEELKVELEKERGRCRQLESEKEELEMEVGEVRRRLAEVEIEKETGETELEGLRQRVVEAEDRLEVAKNEYSQLVASLTTELHPESGLLRDLPPSNSTSPPTPESTLLARVKHLKETLNEAIQRREAIRIEKEAVEQRVRALADMAASAGAAASLAGDGASIAPSISDAASFVDPVGVDEVRAVREELELRIGELTRANRDIEQNVRAQYQADMEELREKLQQKEQQLRFGEQAMDRANYEWHQQRESLREELRRSEAAVKYKEGEILRLNREKNELQQSFAAEISESNSKVEERERVIRQLKAVIKTKEDDLRVLGEEQSLLREQVATLSDESQARTDIDNRASNELIERLTQELQELDAARQEERAGAQEYEDQIAVLKEQLEEAIVGLTQVQEASNEERERLEEQLEDKEAYINQVQIAVEALKGELSRQQSELEARLEVQAATAMKMEEAVREKEAVLGEARREVEVLRVELTQENAKRAQLEKDLRDNLSAKELEVLDLANEVAEMKSRVSELESALSDASLKIVAANKREADLLFAFETSETNLGELKDLLAKSEAVNAEFIMQRGRETEDLHLKIAELESLLHTAKATHESDTSLLRTRMEEETAKLQASEAMLVSHSARIADKSRQLESLREEHTRTVAEHAKSRGSLESRVKLMEAELEGHRSSFEQALLAREALQTEHTATVSLMRESLSAKDAQIETLNAEIKRAQESFLNVEQENERVAHDRLKLQEKLENSLSERSVLQKTVTDLETALSSARVAHEKELTSLREKSAEDFKQLAELDAQLALHKDFMKVKTSELETIREDYRMAQASSAEVRQTLELRVASLESDLSELRTHHAKALQDHEMAKLDHSTAISVLRESLDAKDKKTSSLGSELQSLQEEISKLKHDSAANVAAVAASRDAFSTKLSEVQLNYLKLEKAHLAQNNQLAETALDVESLRNNIKALEDAKTSLEETRTQLGSQLDAQNRVIEQLRTELADREAEVAKLLHESKVTEESLRDEVRILQLAVQKTDRELQNTEQVLLQHKMDISTIQEGHIKDLALWTERVEAGKKDITRLEQEIAAAKVQLDEKTAALRTAALEKEAAVSKTATDYDEKYTTIMQVVRDEMAAMVLHKDGEIRKLMDAHVSERQKADLAIRKLRLEYEDLVALKVTQIQLLKDEMELQHQDMDEAAEQILHNLSEVTNRYDAALKDLAQSRQELLARGNSIEKLKTQVEILGTELRMTREERKVGSRDLEQSSQRNQEHINKIAELQKLITDLQTQLAVQLQNKNNEISNLSTLLANQNAEFDTLVESSKAMSAQHEEEKRSLKALMSQQESDLTSSRQQLALRESEVAQLSYQLEQQKVDHSAVLDVSRTSAAKLEAELGDLKSLIAQSEAVADALRISNADLLSTISNTIKERDEMKGELEAERFSRKELLEKLSGQSETINKLEAVAAGYMADIVRHNEEASSLRHSLDELQIERDRVAAEVEAGRNARRFLDEELQARGTLVEKLKADSSEHVAKISMVESEKQRLLRDLEDARSEIIQWSTASADLRQKLEEHEIEVQQCRQTIVRGEKDLQSVRAALESQKKAEVDLRQVQLAEKDLVITSLNATIARLEEMVSTQESHLSAMRESLDHKAKHFQGVVATLSRDLESRGGRVRELEEKHEELSNTLGELHASKGAQDVILTDLRSQLQTEVTNAESLRVQLQNTQNEMTGRVNQLQTELVNSEKMLIELKASASSKQEDLMLAVKERDDLASKLEEADRTIAEYHEAARNFSLHVESVKNLSQSVPEASSPLNRPIILSILADAGDILKAQAARVKSLEGLVEEKDSELLDHRNIINGLNSASALLNEKIRLLESESATAHKALEDHAEIHRRDLSEKEASHLKELEAREQELQGLKGDIQSLIKQKDDMRGAMQALEESRDDFMAKEAKLREELEVKAAAVAGLQEQLKGEAEALRDTRFQNDQAMERLQDLEESVAELLDDIDVLRDVQVRLRKASAISDAMVEIETRRRRNAESQLKLFERTLGAAEDVITHLYHIKECAEEERDTWRSAFSSEKKARQRTHVNGKRRLLEYLGVLRDQYEDDTHTQRLVDTISKVDLNVARTSLESEIASFKRRAHE